MIELYPFEAICLAVLFMQLGGVAAFAIAAMCSVNDEGDDDFDEHNRL